MIYYSVIIPSYNNADKIERTVKSVLSQTFDNWEIIIVDDGSKDNTEEIIQPLLKNRNIRYFKQLNAGVSAARNKGALKAKGEYLIFLDSDDELNSNALKNYKDLINSTIRVGFFSSGLISPEGKRIPQLNVNISSLKFNNIPGSFGISREIFNKIGGYDLKLKHSENWEMVARALFYCSKNNFTILHQDLFNLIYHFESYSSKNYTRNRNKAHASLYLYKKYYHTGVLHFNKNTFLLEAAVNSIRINKINRGRLLFNRSLKENFSFKTLVRIFITYSPFLRKKIWLRNV